MNKNITWCLMKNIFQNKNFTRTYSLLNASNNFKHTNEGYENQNEKPINIDYKEIKSYKQFLNESKVGPSVAVSALMTTLNVTKENAIKVVTTYKIFNSLSTVTIMDNHRLLREAGIEKSTLRDHMFALADTTPNTEKKIKIIQGVGLEINDAICLFQLTSTALLQFAYSTKNDRNFIPDQNRISYLARELDLDIYKMCTVFCRFTFAFNMRIQKMIEITNCTRESGMSGKNVTNDMMIYKYSTETVKKKLSRAKEIGITPLKPWIVRCTMETLENFEKQKENRRKLLSTYSVQEYIQREMNCDDEVVKALLKRDHTIELIKPENICKIIPLLRDYGYGIEDIYRAPRILHTNDESIREKYDMWMKYSHDKPGLFMLATSHNRYNKLLDVLKNKTKKK